MADSLKGAAAAPKQPEPHPLDKVPDYYTLPPLVDQRTGQRVETTNSLAAEAAGKRAEEVRTERRRRTDTSGEYRAKLQVDESKLDPNFNYRFINDTGGRLKDMTVNDDWDVVTDPRIKSENSNEGTGVRQLVGTKQDGSPLNAYLCRKPKKFWEEDRAKKQARVNEYESQIKRGLHDKPGTVSTTDPNFYAPAGNVLSQKTPGEYKP